MSLKITRLTATAALMVAFFAGSALAQTEWCFVAGLDGSEEVPPTPVTATGVASLFLNAAQTQVSFFVEYDPLPNETAAHFHLAPPGVNGPAIFLLPPGNPKIGVWNVSPAEAQALFDNSIYVNIHTEEYPAGAIRGNVHLCGVSSSAATWGTIKSLYR